MYQGPHTKEDITKIKDIEGNEIRVRIPEIFKAFVQLVEGQNLREGLVKTPQRVMSAYNEVFSGYSKDVESVFTTFENPDYKHMVVLRQVPFFSMCEHHMLPFYGTATIAYIPNNKIIGISKLARLLEIYSHRLQVQERLVEQITSALMTHLEPEGAGCLLKGTHMCMQMRGVKSYGSEMICSSLKGSFLEPDVRAEFLNIANS